MTDEADNLIDPHELNHEGQGVYVTASVLMEYLFCPRFIYFMNCLCIAQHEEQRYKVQAGREVHENKEKVNADYLRKRLGVVDKETGVFLASRRYQIKGIVDEVLTLSDGTMAPLDYKYAQFRDRVFKTHSYQSVFYGLLIKDNYGVDVSRGFVCYVRSAHLLKEIDIRQSEYDKLLIMVKEIIDISQRCYYPKGTRDKAKCVDCCYRNICV
ncbi:MAG: CRISPR-associated protein Cas4 [Nitrospirae bacterium]|nr:CRISPR-associated protein Cas4 [Nitrospirota bacterium]